MGATSIQDAKNLISSSKVADRTNGLKDLIHILKHNRGKPSLDNLGNKAYFSLCESLFRCTEDERAAWLRSKAKAGKPSALLPLCASALRQVIISGVRTFKTSTVETILDHVVQFLPSNNGGFVMPLVEELPKALRALLEYQPHVERLSKECWDTTVDFCLESLGNIFSDADASSESSLQSNGHSTGRSMLTSSNGTPKAIFRETSARERHLTDELTHTAEDFIVCLQLLTQASNAPISDKAEQILSAMTTFLQRRASRGNSAAFATINSVFRRTTLDATSVTQRAIRTLLPLIKALWSDVTLRDEMLITLIQSEAHLSGLLHKQDVENCRSDLESLVETIYGEYKRRQETSALQFLEEDHLCFRHIGSDHDERHPLNTLAFSLGTEQLRCEGLWATVSVVAHFSSILDSKKHDKSSNRDNDYHVPTKRLRTTNYYHEYLRHVSETRSSAKRAALQVIAFMVQESALDEEDLQYTIEKLTPYITDENPVHSTWALVGLTAAAFQKSSKSPTVVSHWVTAWQSACRIITSVSSSRTACHLMDVLLRLRIIPFSAISETVQNLLVSIELNGPALVTEASSSLFTTLIRERAAENPTFSNQTADRILYWLFSKWTPSLFPEREYSVQNAQHCNARDILRLVSACIDYPSLTFRTCSFWVLGPISRAHVYSSNYRRLTQYLLLSDDLQKTSDLPQIKSGTSDSNASERRNSLLEARVIDFCVSEVEKSRQRWKEWSRERPQNVTADMIRIVTNLCLVASNLITIVDGKSPRVAKLESALASMSQALSSFLARREVDQYKADAVLEVCSRYLPDVRELSSLDRGTLRKYGVLGLPEYLARALDDRQAFKESFYVEDDDFMDIDNGADSQATNGSSTSESDVPRHDLEASTSIAALRSSCSAYIHLVSSIVNSSTSEQVELEVPSDFIDYVISISEPDLLSSRQLVTGLLQGPFNVSKPSCQKLLERLGEGLLDPRAREYNTSEVANGMIVEVLVGTLSEWGSLKSPDELFDTAEDLYAYYVKDMEETGVRRSISLQKEIADLLHGMLKRGVAIGQGRKTGSLRTHFFNFLASGDIAVKHHIAVLLPDLFQNFLLHDHGSIYNDDVHVCLPAVKDWSEGIAIRLLVLTLLASRWHTLLRICVYHIFETAGEVEHAIGHARYCMSNVAEALNLESAQELFKIFAPQIIFSWFHSDRDQPDRRKFADVPFSIFGYTGVVDLLRDVEAEAVAQDMMGAKHDELAYKAKLLGLSVPDMLRKNFSKAASYSIAWDACYGKSRKKEDKSFETEMRNYVGDDQFTELLQDHLPRVIGFMFQTLKEEEKLEKSFAKRPSFQGPETALKEMTKISHSNLKLPEGIQPSFSAKFLIDLLDRTARRAGYDAVKLWRPDNFTFVLRMLLDHIHPALGSLYACSIIRKIRLLVAFAGDVVFEGYPLQMTLQSLRPFLTDSQCAEDTLGILQYLFSHGTTFLRSTLSFATGIGLSILISNRVFLGSSQDSTTQESQHAATMNKAQAFHSWFTKYVESYPQSMTDPSSGSQKVAAFKTIMAAASRIRTGGNATKGTDESELLLQLLEHDRSEMNLLKGPSREIAFNLLCQNFQRPASTDDDILGSATKAAEYASQVWSSCHRSDVGDQYLLWAARVLGRTFSAFGKLNDNLHNAPRRKFQAYAGGGSRRRNSREAIVKSLDEMLHSDDRTEVGLAEATIRLLISRLNDDGYVAELEQMLPEYVFSALALSIPEEAQNDSAVPNSPLEQFARSTTNKDVSVWIRDLSLSLCQVGSHDPILGSLTKVLLGIKGTAKRLFPYILHLVLYQEYDSQRSIRQKMSEVYSSWFDDPDGNAAPYLEILIEALLYLRSQPTPKEVTRVDRDHWLEINYLHASRAATFCGMHKSALLFAETYVSTPARTSSRRTSIAPPPSLPTDLQLSIYRNLDEPDSFYGVDRGSSLMSMVERVEYEGDGVKGLLFRSARMDSQMRQTNTIAAGDSRAMTKSLLMLNLNSITHSLLSNDQFRDIGEDAVSSTLQAARKLGQWDIKAPDGDNSEASTLFKAFQGLHYARDSNNARHHLDRQFLATTKSFMQAADAPPSIKSALRTLAALTEVDEIISSGTPEQLQEVWNQTRAREKWMVNGQLDDIQVLLSCRETLFGILSSNEMLRDSLRCRTETIRQIEVEALASSSSIFRKHGALQESLASATYLSDIVDKCKAAGLNVEALAQHEIASVLWEQGEAEVSIRMRQQLRERRDLTTEAVGLSVPVLYAKLGHHMAEARLEKPEQIIQHYLVPAVKELKHDTPAHEAGQVYHEFALFCDKQLQNPDAMEDITRIKTLMERKLQEAQEFERLARVEKAKNIRDQYRAGMRRAMKWHDLDAVEYDRFRRSREEFLRRCLENYLLSLQASDEHDNDVLRVFSLWLEYSDTPLANDAMKSHLAKVPSGKFAVLMNQLSSRLQAEKTDFQHHLASLVFRICKDHPYHGMHQIFAGSKKHGLKDRDDSAKSRQRSAEQIARLLATDKRAGLYWQAISESNEMYHNLAMHKADSDKVGREQLLEKNPLAKEMVRRIPALKVPPATLSIPVRANMDYRNVTVIANFKPKMSIANGLSAPKIITAIGSDGLPYKQLFKSGNDDLRQDAIMEQVFEQVSHLLKNHTQTRLRNLHIRTYKVLPLSSRSGLMEFVPNTIPLHSYLMPAHEKYHPKDMKSEAVRREIANCQSDSTDTRVKVWRGVTEKYNPVGRYFFLERFEDPDVWFEKRLAYTRSTAAISILGHVLGLGDRHCHNILLDEKSGEVVHIDLGVAFEAGRLLPVPEVVPFRLTRDLVDGMGYTRTEGVFRRCCEFTLETLREERESIMTLLNVLRYDPLVNWTITPTKAKRMQEGGETAAGGRAVALDDVGGESSRKRDEQAGEAGRALGVVEKKLSKTLSASATVNELIQMATDDRNLAVLYSGWASYA